ncbi:MAG: alpha-galactosidase [Microthrixaceae bacterium]|nr:alpha-galactosidase [Microthrixaceae bacterium]
MLREPQRLRPIVVNNWEATEMAFDEARLVDLIDRAGALGAEVFLLDDGWFGTTYPRDDDTQGLGDWDPDPAKLPNGFDPLVHAAQSADIRFGTWVEPEMVNPRSDLFEAHPDWVVRDARNLASTANSSCWIRPSMRSPGSRSGCSSRSSAGTRGSAT